MLWRLDNHLFQNNWVSEYYQITIMLHNSSVKASAWHHIKVSSGLIGVHFITFLNINISQVNVNVSRKGYHRSLPSQIIWINSVHYYWDWYYMSIWVFIIIKSTKHDNINVMNYNFIGTNWTPDILEHTAQNSRVRGVRGVIYKYLQ